MTAKQINLFWYGAGCLVLGVVLVALFGLGWYIYGQWRAGTAGAAGSSARAVPRAVRWDGRTPLRCAANDRIIVRGVTANLPSGAAVVATDDCVLTMVDVNVTAPIALQALGNARVTLNQGSLHGLQYAVQALGTARVVLVGTTIDGGITSIGGAEITQQ